MLGDSGGQKSLLRFASVGIEFALSVGVGAWGGNWLDARWGSTPWLTLIGCAAGLGAGYRAIFRALKEANRLAEAEEAREREEREKYHGQSPRRPPPS